MNSSRLQVAETIFGELLEVAVDDREERLSERCGGDEELCALVKRLLENDRSGMSGFLEKPAFVPNDETGRASIGPGARFGRYEVLRKIGEGGMGVVYEARQDNPRRTVALKVLRTAFPSQGTLSRFRHESQVLAQLRHPGIAHIYEAGVEEFTHAGGARIEQPYYAMERVEGRSPREFADSRAMGPRERLELIARVCDAVQYAHERGVIHRDLKPDNLLIEESGQPRVLDFGVARLMESAEGTQTRQTRDGEVLGTLTYMSPEQVTGEAALVDTRSDVYSLGVIAYELLCGTTLLDLRGLLLHEALRRIREESSIPLSARDGRLRGDIEVIVSKAIHRDPARRYESAGALAGDIRRYLRGEAIDARRDSALYVFGKTLRRYRWVVLAVGAMFVLLIGGMAGTIYGLAQARRERDEAEVARRGEVEQRRVADERLAEAERQTRVARAVTRFLTRDLLTGDDPARPLTERDTKLSDVVTRADRLVEAGALKDSPDVEAAVRNTLGHLYINLGRIADAERHTRLALNLSQTAFGLEDADVIVSLNNLAELLQRAGRLTESLDTYRLAFEIADRTKLSAEDLLCGMHNNFAELMRLQNRLEEAEAHYLASLAQCDRLSESNNMKGTLRAKVLGNLGELYRQKKDYQRALDYSDQCIGLLRAALGDEHPSVATALNNKGLALQQSGDPDAAEPLLREALEIRRKTLPEYHPEISQSLNNLGSVARDRARYDEALELYRESLSVAKRSLPPGHYMLAMLQKNVGNALTYLGRFEESETELLAAYEKLHSLGNNAPAPFIQVTVEAIVRLYEKWAEFDPVSGAGTKAAEWRARLPGSTSKPASTAAG